MQISLRQILRLRVLNKTNAIYPQYILGGERKWRGKTKSELDERAPLTCRWKARIPYQDARFRRYGKHDFPNIIKLTEAEADGRFRVSDKELMVNFRGRTHRGGSYKPQVINLDGSEVPVTRKDHQYTFADMFCGGGGTSRGAAMAELKVSLSPALSGQKHEGHLTLSLSNSPAACIWRGPRPCVLRNLATQLPGGSHVRAGCGRFYPQPRD